jgi:deazaflavin-dependent oxidoreductase (nitroreductase family)
MANSAAGEARDFNTQIIEEFRANQGCVDAEFLEGLPVILIHHIGVSSGTERVTPLACYPQPDGSFAVVASNGGSPAHPSWYFNLKAHPRITVELGTQKLTVLAEELDDTARAALWPTLVARAPSLGEAQAKTARQMPLFLLTRQVVTIGGNRTSKASMG